MPRHTASRICSKAACSAAASSVAAVSMSFAPAERQGGKGISPAGAERPPTVRSSRRWTSTNTNCSPARPKAPQPPLAPQAEHRPSAGEGGIASHAPHGTPFISKMEGGDGERAA
eukprot:CAMPEP_0179083410 /NCGR_PEP_ID=MMETSP0796-20121207/37664_1 /TAXON_ID=73915 /ORGANISM="Pyrodinium bahamense, Strain pbaha01" /LENGTH=114 /DNA_ID=CAMNT_0020780817 /DNA_START=268 /DNA_END=613 /DNA_ORIENTATION=+